jgi:hypothetical protein
MKLIDHLLTTAFLITGATAGPLAYGLCQAGCSTVVVACYAAAGVTFGKNPRRISVVGSGTD